MDETHKSQLANLAQGLVHFETTKEWSRAVAHVEKVVGTFEPPVAKALAALKAKLPGPDEKLSRKALQATADKLLKASDEGAKQAGRAVSWALELQPAEKS